MPEHDDDTPKEGEVAADNQKIAESSKANQPADSDFSEQASEGKSDEGEFSYVSAENNLDNILGEKKDELVDEEKKAVDMDLSLTRSDNLDNQSSSNLSLLGSSNSSAITPWIFVKEKLVERAPHIFLADRKRLRLASRRDFLVYGSGAASAAAGFWWLLPDELKTKLGFSNKMDAFKKDFLQQVLNFDDSVATKLFSQTRLVPTYTKKEKTEVPNNYAGQTPDASFIKNWKLKIIGAKYQAPFYLSARDLDSKFRTSSQIVRLVCVEGWSAITEWGGIKFHDFVKAYPPPDGCKWIQLRSEVNLDSDGNSDPYFVSLDIFSALHPQTLLATAHNGEPLELEHGAPLRLIAPTKLGLKNIKAITSIEYCTKEPDDYWNQYGYSYYDGI